MKKLLFILSFLYVSHLFSQPLRLHIGGGFANYNGDLQAKRFTLNQAHGVVSAGGSFNLTNNFALRSDYSFAKLSADDKKSSSSALRGRNLNFKTIIQELSLIGEYDLFDLTQKVWSPYIFAGIGVYRFSPNTTDTFGRKVYLLGYSTEGQGLPEYPDRKPYKRTQLNIPIGGGIKYALSDDIHISVEMGLRKLFTDYLDDVSTNYADENILLAARGPEAVALAFRGDELKSNPSSYPAEGTQRGSPKYKDLYYFGQFRISFRMNWFDNGGSNNVRSSSKRGIGCPTKVL